MNKFGFLIAFLVFTLSVVTLVLLLVVEPPGDEVADAAAEPGKSGSSFSASKVVRNIYKAKKLTTPAGQKAAQRRMLNKAKPRSVARRVDKTNKDASRKSPALASDGGAVTEGQESQVATTSAGAEPAPAAGVPGEEKPKPVPIRSLMWTPENDEPPYVLSLGTFTNKNAGDPTVERLALANYESKWAEVLVEEYNREYVAWLLYTTSCDDKDCAHQLQLELGELGLNSRLIREPPPRAEPEAAPEPPS